MANNTYLDNKSIKKSFSTTEEGILNHLKHIRESYSILLEQIDAQEYFSNEDIRKYISNIEFQSWSFVQDINEDMVA